MVDIPKDAKSAQFVAGGFKVTLTPKENVRWDQDALDAAFQRLGDTFLKPFKYEWKPRSAKALGAFMEYAGRDQVAAISVAMSASAASRPSSWNRHGAQTYHHRVHGQALRAGSG